MDKKVQEIENMKQKAINKYLKNSNKVNKSNSINRKIFNHLLEEKLE